MTEIQCLIEMDYHREVVQDQVEAATKPLHDAIRCLETQVKRLAEEKWKLTEELSLLQGFIAGHVDIATEEGEDVDQMVAGLSAPMGSRDREKARVLFVELSARRVDMMRGVYHGK